MLSFQNNPSKCNPLNIVTLFTLAHSLAAVRSESVKTVHCFPCKRLNLQCALIFKFMALGIVDMKFTNLPKITSFTLVHIISHISLSHIL